MNMAEILALPFNGGNTPVNAEDSRRTVPPPTATVPSQSSHPTHPQRTQSMAPVADDLPPPRVCPKDLAGCFCMSMAFAWYVDISGWIVVALFAIGCVFAKLHGVQFSSAGSAENPSGGAAYTIVLSKSRAPALPRHVRTPAWVSDTRWMARRDKECEPQIRVFNGLIVHRASATVVGYVSGQLVRRGPAMVSRCDDYSQELIDMVGAMLTTDGSRLRPELKRGSIWGDALDHGRIAVVEKVELDPAHRGKGALKSIAHRLRDTLNDWGVTCAVCYVGALNECAISSSSGAPHGSMPKIRKAFASMGFRRVGITNWMAMVVDPRHACWDPATDRYPSFPFQQLRSTAGQQALKNAVWRCTGAATRLPETVSERQRGAFKAGREKMYWDAVAGLDAIAAADPSKLFEADGRTVKTVPAELLHNLLSDHENEWIRDAEMCAPAQQLLNALRVVVSPRPEEDGHHILLRAIGLA